MLPIIVKGRGLIPRTGMIAPVTKPFKVPLQTLAVIVMTPKRPGSISTFFVDPVNGSKTELTSANYKKIYEEFMNRPVVEDVKTSDENLDEDPDRDTNLKDDEPLKDEPKADKGSDKSDEKPEESKLETPPTPEVPLNIIIDKKEFVPPSIVNVDLEIDPNNASDSNVVTPFVEKENSEETLEDDKESNIEPEKIEESPKQPNPNFSGNTQYSGAKKHGKHNR